MTAHFMQAGDELLPESLGKPFASSLALHIGLVAAVVAYAWWSGSTNDLGDINAGGQAVGVSAVSSIPLPNRGPENPLAEDTKSHAVPEPPPEKPQPKVREPDPEDAIAIRKAKTKQLPVKQNPPPTTPKFKPLDEIAPERITVKTPPAASSPLFAPVSGAGQIGAVNTTMGTRFPGYASSIRETISREWGRTTREVDQNLHTAPPVVASFQVLRDGSVRAVRIVQSSGIPALDTSVRRAIEDAKLQEFPTALKDSSISVEIRFELKR